MDDLAVLPEAFVFMKVGNHANETWEDILERKRREFEVAGQIFWGYGGSACHPTQQVQPFVKSHIQKQGAIYLVMQTIVSNADPDIVQASEYSADGVHWEPIPDGIEVRGSRYAIVLDEIKPINAQVNTATYQVGVGPSQGRRATDYLKGRIDKARLLQESQDSSAEHEVSLDEKAVKKVDYIAQIKEPYAVLLR